jgi:hypothetical protein
MSLPATTRHRWGLDDGGDVAYIDLGDAVVIVPGGVEKLRRHVLESVSEADWEHAQAGFGDPELANE